MFETRPTPPRRHRAPLAAIVALVVACTGCVEIQPRDSTARADASDDLTETPAVCEVPLLFLVDADGDGHGVAGLEVSSCEQPPGFAPATATADCDDTDALISPERQQLCFDGRENTCGTRAPDSACQLTGRLGLGALGATRRGHAPGEHVGSSVAVVTGASDADLDAWLAIGADDARANGEATLAWLLPAPLLDTRTIGAGLRLTLPATEATQVRVASAGDLDADGFSDLAVSAGFREAPPSGSQTWVVFGSPALHDLMRRPGGATLDLVEAVEAVEPDGEAPVAIEAVVVFDDPGSTVAAMAGGHDLDGDEIDDLIVAEGGRIVQVTGSATRELTVTTRVDPTRTSHRVVNAVAVLDADGDGALDIVLTDAADASQGRLLAHYGPTLTGPGVVLDDIDLAACESGAAGARLAASPAGDGTLVVGLPCASPTLAGSGELLIVQGGAGRWPSDGSAPSTELEDSVTRVSGPSVGAGLGSAMVVGSSLSAPVEPVVFVGARAANGTRAAEGVVYAVPTMATGIAASLVELSGQLAGAEAGQALAAGDLNGDGVADLVIGAPALGLGVEAPDSAGAVHIVFGGGQ